MQEISKEKARIKKLKRYKKTRINKKIDKNFRQKMITSDILQNRIENFWGYGNLESPIWLVGLEEGFRSAHDDIADRKMLERQFLLSTANGIFDARRPINPNYCDLTNLSPFLPNARIQSTWKFPIMLYLFLRDGICPNENKILDFQHYTLADGEKNEMATLELSPLPSPGIGSWLFSDVAGFETRKSYFKVYRKPRVQMLKELVQKYSPTLKLVIIYGVSELRSWNEIIGKIPEKVTHQMYFTKTEKTFFCVIPQNWHNSMTPTRLCEYAEKIKNQISIL